MNTLIKNTLIFAAVMAVVAMGGWYGRKAYQKATEHQLVTEATTYLEKRDFRNASLCLQRAFQINPFNVALNKLTADLLEEVGNPQALDWRIRAAQLQTNDVEYRFDWAKTALKMNDLPGAIQALRGVDERSRTTAEFHKLAGALAWDIHDNAAAEKEFSEALRLQPTNAAVYLNLATVHLVSTNKTVADQARLTLENFPTNSPLHLTAIRYLAADAAAHDSFARALFYSQEMVEDSKATYADKLTRLQILRRAAAPGFGEWQAALKADASLSPNLAYALAHWMQKEESPAIALGWLQSLPSSTQTNMPTPLAMADCQLAMNDWKGLLTVVQKQDWNGLDYYRLSLASLACRSLGKDLEAKRAWQRGFLLSTHHLDRLTRLNQLTAVWGWAAEREDVLEEIVSSFPKEAWASEELSTILYADGNTHALADLLDKMYSANPSNALIENNLATVLLLLKSDIQRAHRLAQEAYVSSTNNAFFACTYAYSLFLQSKPEAATTVLNSLKTEQLKNPSIAVYYGVIEAGTGHKSMAKEPLKLAATARLLPEEMELVRQAVTQL